VENNSLIIRVVNLHYTGFSNRIIIYIYIYIYLICYYFIKTVWIRQAMGKQHAGGKEYMRRDFLFICTDDIVRTCGLVNPFVDSSEGI